MLSPEEVKTRVVQLRHFINRYARHTSDCAISVAIRHPHRVLPEQPQCTCGYFDDYAALTGKNHAETYQTR